MSQQKLYIESLEKSIHSQKFTMLKLLIKIVKFLIVNKSRLAHLLLFILISPLSLLANDWNRSTGNNESHLYSKDIQINESNIKNF